LINCLQEDLRLGELVKLHGPKKWSQIAADLNTNKGSKQVRAAEAARVSLGWTIDCPACSVLTPCCVAPAVPAALEELPEP
jgi:hypothetical protein